MNTYLKFKYSTESHDGICDADCYILQFNEDIIAENDEDGEFLVGKATQYLFLLEQAQDEGYPIFDILDSTLEFCGTLLDIYDVEEGEIKEDIKEKIFGDCDEMLNGNICYLSRMAILPKYRGYGISKRVIRDNYRVFGSSCGLFAGKPFPLQLEHDALHDSDFERQMDYEQMEKDEKKAYKRLYNYYKSIGFIGFRGCDLIFLTPGYTNKKLEAIDMDTPIQDLRK